MQNTQPLAKKISIGFALAIGFSILSILSANAAATWGSINFNGSQYLSSTNMSAPGSGAFTYEFWFYNTATAGSNQTLMNTRGSVTTGQNKDGFDVAIDSNRKLYASYKMLMFFATSDGAISTNRWYHFAIVRTGNIVYGYLDGSLIGSQTLDSDGLNLYSQKLWIGSTAGGANKFNGYISNFRYTKQDLYSANFALPTDEYAAVTNTSILLNTKNDTTFATNSIAGTTFTNNGSATASSQTPFTEPAPSNNDEETRKKAERERLEKVRIAREKINASLLSNQTITIQDMQEADIPLKSVDSLLAAYHELTTIKFSLTQPLTPQEQFQLKFNKIMKYVTIERLTGLSIERTYGFELAKYEVIPQNTPQKEFTTYQLLKLPVADRDTLAKVNSFFANSTAKFAERKAHLSKVLNRG